MDMTVSWSQVGIEYNVLYFSMVSHYYFSETMINKFYMMVWKERLNTQIKHIWQMVQAMDSAEDNWTVPQELQGQPYAVSFILALP